MSQRKIEKFLVMSCSKSSASCSDHKLVTYFRNQYDDVIIKDRKELGNRNPDPNY